MSKVNWFIKCVKIGWAYMKNLKFDSKEWSSIKERSIIDTHAFQ